MEFSFIFSRVGWLEGDSKSGWLNFKLDSTVGSEWDSMIQMHFTTTARNWIWSVRIVDGRTDVSQFIVIQNTKGYSLLVEKVLDSSGGEKIRGRGRGQA